MQGSNNSIVDLFDIRFNDLTFEQLCSWIDGRVASEDSSYVVTANVDHVCWNRRDTNFRQAYRHASAVVCDGMPLIYMSRLLGRPIREKLSGSDLVDTLSGHAARRSYSVFLFGAAEGVAAAAADRLRETYPGLRVAGVHSPPMGFYADEMKNAEALRQIARTAPDICFVAMGAPHQEIWMWRNHEASNARVMIGIGGSFDLLTGRTRRAPLWMQRAGLEWVWRLAQEPGRLWRRYLVDDMQILVIFGKEFWNRRIWRAGTT